LPYKGVVDCFSRTVKSEGYAALFKGVVPRVMVISPLFGKLDRDSIINV
jgi:hypothetical protein